MNRPGRECRPRGMWLWLAGLCACSQAATQGQSPPPPPATAAVAPASPMPAAGAPGARVAAAAPSGPAACDLRRDRLPGLCNVSAMVLLPDCRLLAADDEDRSHRLFAIAPGAAQAPAPVPASGRLLGGGAVLDDEELDLEGAAWVGDRIYWIGSHGNNKLEWKKGKGEHSAVKEKPNRHILFATALSADNDLEPVGTPYRDLARELVKSIPGLASTYKAVHSNAGGLNVEGLAADGEALLIGLRSPVSDPDRRAYVFRLENPAEVLGGKPARVGGPYLLDLGKRGVRSLEWSPSARAWFIVAGPVTHLRADPDAKDGVSQVAGYGEGTALYRWESLDKQPVLVKDLADAKGLQAEGLIATPAGLFVTSDDDEQKRGGKKKCENLPADDPDRYTRSLWIEGP
ncbi:uncharacterized protein SOCE26_026090 [Sorangium cellulosum]|uniref:DUF3616 domain-containing protein n=1 Tax=Sorangium cellulosum TaxID=56 RepID=A0A2L0EPH3_SORCE|nr:DUF3616 domain-containing protein [Sorangium cellulosum]AUX41199.1 uncharacterized protein SOCE26_026090 [Sorangium cellulosum]